MSDASRRPIGIENDLPLPPNDLAMRVGGTFGEEFRERGKATKECLLRSLPEDFDWRGKRVLDFGCGAGRTLRHFAAEASETEFWGCDIDARSINWLKRSAGHLFKIFANTPEPKLAMPSNYFDLVYCISVFTHIPKNWSEWLEELRRIIAPDGTLLCTFHERTAYEFFLKKPFRSESVGMRTMWENRSWDQGGPFVFHSNRWIVENWGKLMPLDYIICDGMLRFQNTAVMHRPGIGDAQHKITAQLVRPFPLIEWQAGFVGDINYDPYAPKSWLTQHGIPFQEKAVIRGWFTSSEGPITDLDFYLDNVQVHADVSRLQRPDVQQRLPNMPYALDSGFQSVLDTRHVEIGVHRVTIWVHDGAGRKLQSEVSLFPSS
jgi:SAM-dependent methyltransferase